MHPIMIILQCARISAAERIYFTAAAAYHNCRQAESHRCHIQPFPICLICFSSVPTLPHDWHGTAGSTANSGEARLTVKRICLPLISAFLVSCVTEHKIHFEIRTFYELVENTRRSVKISARHVSGLFMSILHILLWRKTLVWGCQRSCI